MLPTFVTTWLSYAPTFFGVVGLLITFLTAVHTVFAGASKLFPTQRWLVTAGDLADVARVDLVRILGAAKGLLPSGSPPPPEA
jgi:hypothetical protein